MKYLITLLLVFLFPIRFVIATLPHYGLAWLSSFLLYIEVLLLLLCLINAAFHYREAKLNTDSKFLIFLYLIYFAFILYQVRVSPQVPRDLMMDVPLENSTFYRDLFIQSVSMFLVLGFRNKIDFVLFAKITVLLTFFSFFAYYNKVDFRVYGVIDLLDKKNSEEEEGIITSFAIAGYMVFAFFCNYIAKGKWVSSKLFDNIVFYLCALVFFLGLIITIKRGPILSFCAVSGLLLFMKYRKKLTMFITLSAFLCFLGFVLFGDYLLTYLEENASGLLYRFSVIGERGGSGRFGSDDSVFSVALKQIIGAPVFGSYFRLLKVDVGAYPHNIILELLMTGGLLLSIPFFILLCKALKIDIKLIKLGGEQSLPALCFLYILLSLMTSSSLLFKTQFWVFLAILCSYNIKKIKYNE